MLNIETMIVSHRLIKMLTPVQVYRILDDLGKWAIENRKGGLNLPRFPINLVGTPPNIKIARLLLHSAAEEDIAMKSFFGFYLSNRHSKLMSEIPKTQDVEPDTSNWGTNATWILIYLHDKLIIDFKNQVWQVECLSEMILGNPEVRELIQMIRIDTSKIQAKLVVWESNVGKIVMGNETNIYNQEKTKEEKQVNADKKKIIAEVEKGRTKEAIIALYLYLEEDKTEQNNIILLKSRYENNMREYALGTRTQEDYLSELQKINESILKFIE